MSPRKKLSENESEFIKGSAKPSADKPAQSREDILSQILKPAPTEPKEATIRFTADLPWPYTAASLWQRLEQGKVRLIW